MQRPLKPTTTTAQQITLLRERGMDVDEDLACQWLSNVSYYRLSAYWFPARCVNQQGKRTDSFVAGTTFSDVVTLYEADRKLRTLIHDGLERIEIAARARIGKLLCARHPLAYTTSTTFRPSFDHTQWMLTARKRINRAARHNEAIKHYRDEYGGRYPFWVLADVLDFSDISRLLEGLKSQDQRTIAEGLGIVVDLAALSKNQRNKTQKQSPLVRWMEQLTIVRNTCAHHGRLWNKSFSPAPTAALRTVPEMMNLPEGQSERIFGALTIMAHLLRETSPGTKWPAKITDLIRTSFLTNRLASPKSLGLPDGWNGTL